MYKWLPKKMDQCILSFVVALIITGATWFYTSPLIGSVNRGFPLAYHFTPVIQYPVSSWNYLNLVIDIVVWWIIAFAVMYALKFKKKAKK